MKDRKAKPLLKQTAPAENPQLSFNGSITQQRYTLDTALHSWAGQLGIWLSPSALLLAYADWLIHFGLSPDKYLTLYQETSRKYMQLFPYIVNPLTSKKCELCVPIKKSDHRFQNELWNTFPINIYSQLFLLNENIWNEATTNIRGVSKHYENLVNFTTRQKLDIFVLSNFPFANPEVIQATINESGMNFVKGFKNWLEDVNHYIKEKSPVGAEQFKVGKNVAITPAQKIHTVSYCIGGTVLMIAAPAMAKNKDDKLKSITLFAAQVDFNVAGELLLFIDESQTTYLEDIMMAC